MLLLFSDFGHDVPKINCGIKGIWFTWNIQPLKGINMLKNILLSFIPLFVAVDAIGVMPMFVGLTAELDEKAKTRVVVQSMLTAACLAIAFVLGGRLLFRWLGISIGDFMIAGGAILFSLAIIDLVNPTKKRRAPEPDLGVVPLGTPLIAGPAVLTISMLIVSEYGLIATMIALLGNILIAGLILRGSILLTRVLGASGAKALSKITSLLLAAIAVMLIRKGFEEFLRGLSILPVLE
jgi:multiple antibiotic resistance protein